MPDSLKSITTPIVHGMVVVNPDGTNIGSGLISSGYDYIVLTYVVSGNGAGQIQTVIFKTGGAGGTTVSTQTFTYTANNVVETVTKT